MAKDEVTPRRLDKDADRRLRALDRSAHAPVKKAAKKTKKRNQSGGTGRGLVFVIAGIGLFLLGLVRAGHHPDMRVVAASAIVGVLVLFVTGCISTYRRTESAGADRTEKVEGRVQQSTSTNHFLDGA